MWMQRSRQWEVPPQELVESSTEALRQVVLMVLVVLVVLAVQVLQGRDALLPPIELHK